MEYKSQYFQVKWKALFLKVSQNAKVQLLKIRFRYLQHLKNSLRTQMQNKTLFSNQNFLTLWLIDCMGSVLICGGTL